MSWRLRLRWRSSMQSPDNFTIMNGLRRTREPRTARNLRLSTLTFECNHGRVTRAVHCMLPHTDLTLWSLCINEKRRDEQLRLFVCTLLSITTIQEEVGIFRLVAEIECVRDWSRVWNVVHYFRHWRLKSFNHDFMCDFMHLWECSNIIFEIAQSNIFL